MRVAAIVIAFVVANAGGFAIYRSLASTPTAPVTAPPADISTVPQPAAQPNPVPDRPEQTTPPDASPPPIFVGENTEPSVEVDVDEPRTSRTSRSRPAKIVKQPTRSAAPDLPAPRPPPPPRAEPTPEPQPDKLLEMEANPYKRAE
jgi:hypothetical protein